jgi:polysaccharide biosynthesis protein PslH
MRILAISSWWPFPADNGARMRISSLIETLSQSHEVHLAALSQEPVSTEQIAEAKRFCASAQEVQQRVWSPRPLEQVSSLWRGAPASVRATYNPSFAQLVQERVRTLQPDIIIAFELAAASYARQIVGIPRIFEELEITNILDQYRLAEPHQRLRNWLTWLKHRTYVRRLLQDFDACSVVSERERLVVKQIAPTHMPIEVIPNGASMAPLVLPPKVQSDTLIYPGALSYSANLDAMRFFLSQIFPSIYAVHPSVRLQITGKVTSAQREALPSLDRVELTGYVPDIRTTVAAAYAEVVPLREGGGTRLKILEALALGTPVISTRKGAEGLDLRDGHDILLADTPRLFAEATHALLANPALREKLSIHGQQTVLQKYDWRVIGARLNSLIEQTVAEHYYEQHSA